MLVDLWTKDYDRNFLVIAGDDDQTVHEWNGATPDYLIEYSNNNLITEILEHSYRLPKNVSGLCNSILSTIKKRQKKTIQSDKSDGNINYYYHDYFTFLKFFVDYTHNNTKTIYLLFRTRKIMNELQNILFNETDIPYGVIGDKESSRWNHKFITLSNALNKISSGKDLTYFEVNTLFGVLPSNSCLIYGIKSKIKKVDDKNTKISCQEVLNMTKRWSVQRDLNSFNSGKTKQAMKDDMILYITYVKPSGKTNNEQIKKIEQNENYQRKLRKINMIFDYSVDESGQMSFKHNIELGTFHASKGLEAETVIVFLGTSFFFKDIDDAERRCFYVACSRTKKDLIFISSYNMDMNIHKDFLESEFEYIIKKYDTKCLEQLEKLNKGAE